VLLPFFLVACPVAAYSRVPIQTWQLRVPTYWASVTTRPSPRWRRHEGWICASFGSTYNRGKSRQGYNEISAPPGQGYAINPYSSY
jgi:hypothetical protein